MHIGGHLYSVVLSLFSRFYHFSYPIGMRQIAIKVFVSLLSVVCLPIVNAQEKGVSTVDSLNKHFLNWYNLDPVKDKIQGASVNRAYTDILMHKSPRKKIVVAVIDGGVDISHKDLQGKIWINTDEISDNGIDDDNNGYVDDIHGWNFIGNAKGENIHYENLELVRIVKKFNSKFTDVQVSDQLSKSDQEEYALYMTCKEIYEQELKEYQDTEKLLSSFETGYNAAENTLKSFLKKEQYCISDLKGIKSAPDDVKKARTYMLYLDKNGFTPQTLKEMKAHTRSYLDYRLNLGFDPRTIISDNPEDITDDQYGNNDVKGPSPEHGTFVAGIIAANRGNHIGTDGIAENVEIMVLRAVPDGDERDKDIALAIRYAVDNGAQVINMSFGKDYSPQKFFVDEAIRYAGENNVLVVHAAGNEAENLDENERYPTSNLHDGVVISSWLDVGASTHKLNKEFCGSFSNYGQHSVDLFAPGVNMISLFPKNTYKMSDGTSFSSPVVSGVAALVWSYFPGLTAPQLKDILLNSAIKYPRQMVYLPGQHADDKTRIRFSSLSKTGGIVNAYEALKIAETITGN